MNIRTAAHRLRNLLAAILLVGSLTITGSLAEILPASAIAQSASPQPRVSFTFDDGFTSTASKAAPVLAGYGYSGTSYVVTDCIGVTVAPNSCQANNYATYMTWDDIDQLQNSYGWEIGSHTKTHPYLATSDPDDQPFEITHEQMVQELAQSKIALNNRGYDAESFATPYGDYDQETLTEIAKYYTTQRGFGDVGYNVWPYSDYFLHVQQVQAGVSVAEVQGYIDRAIANNEWLILVFHDINDNPSSNPLDYEYSMQDLGSIASYLQANNVDVVNVSDALVDDTNNLVPNGSFQDGLSGGWSTDAGSLITADNGNNGSFTDSQHSIKLTSGSENQHLFSPKVSVNDEDSYAIKTYLNVQSIQSGAVSYYIDEYDSAGNWVSGQFKVFEGSRFVQRLNITYTPTSNQVRSASLQVIVQGNSGITAYIDSVQWLALSEAPAPANLMANGQFDNGIAEGWSTNYQEGITADSAGNGAATGTQNSVKLTANVMTNRHLFSPQTNVSSSNAYEINSWLNVEQLTFGQIAFYIDEYDTNGNWISGQYKTDYSDSGVRTVSMAYQPTSQAVETASMQVIITAASDAVAYIDDIRFYQL